MVGQGIIEYTDVDGSVKILKDNKKIFIRTAEVGHESGQNKLDDKQTIQERYPSK